MTRTLDRVIPVIGDAFKNAHLLVYNMDWFGPIADIAYRLGAKVSLIADDRWVSYSRYLFNNEILTQLVDSGYPTAAHAWSIRMQQHMEYPPGQIEIVYLSDLPYIQDDYTLVVGGGSYEDCAMALTTAYKRKLPAVVGAMTEAHSVTFCHPDGNLERSRMDRFLAALMQSGTIRPSTDPLRAGELLDCVGWFVKALVMMPDEERRSKWLTNQIRDRKDLIIRGTAASPFQIWLNDVKYCGDYSGDRCYNPNRDYAAEKEVWVIGCGTGSLFIQEGIPYFRKLTLIDCKPFSEFNPVRQMMGVGHVGKQVKSLEMMDEIVGRWESLYAPDWYPREYGPRCDAQVALNPYICLRGVNAQPQTEEDMNFLLDELGEPDLVVLATGMTTSDNHHLANALRKRGIKHVIPSALPAALYHKIIICMADGGPCYSCLQGKQTVDQAGPDLPQEARELFYGGTQPATMFETYPSARALLRIVLEMLAPPGVRARWFSQLLQSELTCLLWGNDVQEMPGGGYLHDVDTLGELVAFGVQHMVGWPACSTCGRLNGVSGMRPCLYCRVQAAQEGSDFCGSGHAALHRMKMVRAQKAAPAISYEPLDLEASEDPAGSDAPPDQTAE